MKAIILNDEINQFHWAMLKSVLLVLSLLPVSYLFVNAWQMTDANSQIMLGFFAISLISTLFLLSFTSAVWALSFELTEYQSVLERKIVHIYRYLPMLSLAAMVSYLAMQI